MRILRSRQTPLAALTLVLGAVISAGCNNGSTTPTPTLSTEDFTGTVAVSGWDSKQFTVNYQLTASDASVTVTALTSTATGTPVSTTIGVAFGSFAFDGSCTAASAYTATAAPIGQELVASGAFGPGRYCIKVFDAGTLTESINYAITVKHY
jgi:hypothetical protein